MEPKAGGKSEGLFSLIKTLEKSEKRHIRLLLNSSYKKEASRYSQIFDTLDKQEEYDEDKLYLHLNQQFLISRE